MAPSAQPRSEMDVLQMMTHVSRTTILCASRDEMQTSSASHSLSLDHRITSLRAMLAVPLASIPNTMSIGPNQ